MQISASSKVNGKLTVQLRLGLSCLSVVLTYVLVRQLGLEHIWSKMMPVELKWFTIAFFAILGVCILSLVVIKEEIFHGPLVATTYGALVGYVSGSLGSIIAGHVRGGILFRLAAFTAHPWEQIVSGLMTATWLVGITSFVLLYLMVTLMKAIGNVFRRSPREQT
jgi:hypothetical protein